MQRGACPLAHSASTQSRPLAGTAWIPPVSRRGTAPIARARRGLRRLRPWLAIAVAVAVPGVAHAGSPAPTRAAPTHALAPSHAPASTSGPIAQRTIVGGTRIGIAAAPWQVDVWTEDATSVSDCGGAILNASTVLTAAHCVEGTTPGNPPTKGGLAIWAGTASINAKTASAADRLGLQERRVASVRVHPQWTGKVETSGDLALLRLASPLQLDGRRVAAIALPPELRFPETEPLLVSRALTVTGYGLMTGGTNGTTDGRLRRLPITVTDPDVCNDDDDAIALCATTPRGSACSGDSGGPVVAASAAPDPGAPTVPGSRPEPASGPVLAGIVSNGPRSCGAGGANRYVNLAAPENRAWVLGDNDPPIAPRRRAPARFTSPTDALRVGQRVTCLAGTFAGERTTRTLVSTTDGTTVLLTAGSTATVTLTADLVGRTLKCRGYAASDGGISLSRVATASGPVLGATDPEPGQCAAPRDASLRIVVPATARPGDRITITATLDDPSPVATTALLVVRRTATGGGTLRRVRSIPAGSASARVRISYVVPRSAAARRQRFQAVLATFPDVVDVEAAGRTTALGAACDVGDATFSLRVAR